NGAKIGVIRYELDFAETMSYVFVNNLQTYVILTIFMLVMTVFANYGTLRILTWIQRRLNELEEASKKRAPVNPDWILESESFKKYKNPLILSFLKLLKQYSDQMRQASSYERELRISQSLGEMASQVAHDIRSPLAALNVLEKELKSLGEEQRLLVRSAINRITEIANNLLRQNRRVPEVIMEGLGSSARPKQ